MGLKIRWVDGRKEINLFLDFRKSRVIILAFLIPFISWRFWCYIFELLTTSFHEIQNFLKVFWLDKKTAWIFEIRFSSKHVLRKIFLYKEIQLWWAHQIISRFLKLQIYEPTNFFHEFIYLCTLGVSPSLVSRYCEDYRFRSTWGPYN